MSIKTKRISSEMVKVISNILMEEARDEILKGVTITACEVTNDLSYAKVYFTSLSNIDHKTLEKELEEASSFIRLNVSEKMDLRNTPKLKFIYDDSISYGEKIEKKLKEINNE